MEKLRNTLFVLAGLMLIACGIVAAIPTGGTSLLLGLGGAAALTAGVGFLLVEIRAWLELSVMYK